MNIWPSILVFALCGIVFSSARSAYAGDNHPFPHNFQFAHGIVPTNFSQAQKNADVVAMWQAWRNTNCGLMAWRVGPDNKVFNNLIAPDGDIDAAFVLLVADQKGGSAGTINYRQAATNSINCLMTQAP